MKIAFLGCGHVGGALAAHLQRLGHSVTLAARDQGSESVRKLLAKNPGLAVSAPGDAVKGAEVVFLATPYEANEAALRSVAANLRGKVLVDCTNPVAPDLSHGLKSVRSGSETVQALVPEAHVVKAFTVYGFENFATAPSPLPGGTRPAMPIAGDDSGAKEIVSRLVVEMGWEPLDCGNLAQSLHLEHMTLLWIRLVRVDRRRTNLLWAVTG